MDNLFTLSSALLALLYIIILTAIFGWQKSFSDTYYIKQIGWKFSVWCWSMALLLFLGLYETTPMVLFPSFGFTVVGFTPKMRESWIKPMHFYGAFIIILGAVVMVAAQIDLIYGLSSGVIIALFAWLSKKYEMRNYILWIEILAFTLMYIKIL